MFVDSTPHARNENRAVSPVIGVVLMVAITIILAAAIGTLVFGLTPAGDETAPVASLTIQEGTDETNVTIVHDGGDTIQLQEYALLLDGEPSAVAGELDGTVRSGEQRVVNTSTAVTDVEVALRHDPSGDIVARTTIH